MTETDNFDLKGIQLEARHPLDVNKSFWPILQQNALLAFTDSLVLPKITTTEDGAYAEVRAPVRTQEEVGFFVKIRQPQYYRDTRRNPNLLVGKEFNADQSFSRPSLIIARDGGDIVGHLYVADNVSGATEKIREQKRNGRLHKHRFIREVVVRPEYQHRGIALAMAHLALKGAMFGQPASAYAYPEADVAATNTALLLKFKGLNCHLVGPSNPFGPEDLAEAVDMYRYSHRNARSLARQIGRLPGAEAAFKSMKPIRSWHQS